MSQAEQELATPLRDLLARLEKAEGRDCRETQPLSDDIARAFGWKHEVEPDGDHPLDWWTDPDGYSDGHSPPNFAGSLDAALALVERAAPHLSVENLGEMSPDCGPLAGHWLAQLRPRVPRRRVEGPITAASLQASFDAFAPVSAKTPALALLTALLTSMEEE